ncbi:hypothetical protein V6N13_061142 [Hibiscus sabdariffa]
MCSFWLSSLLQFVETFISVCIIGLPWLNLDQVLPEVFKKEPQVIIFPVQVLSLLCLEDGMQCTIQASFKMQVHQESYVLLLHQQPLFRQKYMQKSCSGTLSATMNSQGSCEDSFF